MRRKVELQIITEALGKLGPHTPAARLWGRAPGASNEEGASGNVWAADIHDLALHICTRLFGRPDATPQTSPLVQAEDAKRARDLGAEMGALVDGYARLTTAPWYPARPGDLVHIHHEGHGQSAPWGETYIVGSAEHGMLSLQPIASTLPDTEWSGAGCYATEDSDDPLADMWMEAGPHRLTVVRDGRPVHIGGAR